MLQRLFVIACLLLGLFTTVSGQARDDIQSLKLELAKALTLEERVNALWQLSKAFDAIHTDSSLTYAELAFSAAQQGTSDSLLFKVSSRLSGAYYDKKQQKKTLFHAKAALELARKLGDSVKVAQALRLQALAIPAISREDAISAMRHTIDIVPDSSPSLRRINMRNSDYLAYLLKYRHPEEAFSIQKEVLAQAIELQDSLQIAASYSHLGMYQRNTSADSALFYFKLAQKAFTQQNHRQRMADNAAKLASCFQLKDMPDSVLFYAQQAIRWGKETGSVAPQRQGLKAMLAHYNDVGEFDKALSYAEEILTLEKANPSGYLSMIWIDFGSIYQEKGEGSEAKKYFEKALVQAQQDAYPPGIATANAYLGELALSEKRYDAAEQYMLQADGLYERMKIAAARSRSFQGLGEIALAKQEPNKAAGFFEKLRDLSAKLDDPSGQATAERGLARCDSAQGKFTGAYGHMLAFAAHQSQFTQQSYDEKVAKLETSFEAERREAANKALAQTNKIQAMDLKASRSRNSLLLLAAVMGTALATIFVLYTRLRSSKKQLETQAIELKDLNQTKDRIFGIIAHDLRGPVTGFQTLGKIFSHHLKAGNTAKLQAISDRIDQQSSQLKNLLDNLLQWSLQQLGTYRPQWEEILLKPLSAEVVTMYADSSAVKENKIQIEIPEDLHVKVDKNGLRVVLNNLLNNAIKFTEKGTIRLLARKEADLLRIEVADTGRGMSAAQLAEFEAQGSLASERGTAGERGTGLGLSLVKQLIQRWGGEIKIQSEVQQGTRIQLNLPVIE